MPESTPRQSPVRIALRIAGLYFVFGGLWIQFSDTIVETLVSDISMLTLVQTFKGWLFVLVTALLLCAWTVRLLREAGAMRSEAESTRHWLEQVGEYMDDVVWVMDGQFHYQYISPSVRHQRGLTPDEVLARGIRGSMDEPTYRRVTETMRKDIAKVRERHAKGESDIVRDRLDIEVRGRAGRPVPVEVRFTVLGDGDGGISAIFGVTRNVSERRRAQEALRESEAQMRWLLNAIPDVAFLMLTDGTIVAANRAAGEHMHVPAPQLVGKSADDMLPAKIAAYRKDQVDLAVRSQTRVRFEDFYGGAHWVHSVSPVFDSEGRVTMVAILARDATHYRESLRAREAAEKDLEKQRSLAARADRLRSLGEMATGIAHELNQPLVGVRGLAEHMLIALERRWDLEPSEVKQNLDLIVEQADRMHHIIEHVRMFSREAGQGDPSSVSVNQVVRSSLGMVGRQFESQGLALDTDMAEGLPRILANPYSLEEVVLNLLSNARHSVQERLARGESLETPHIVLRTRRASDGGVAIEVQDRGMGIDPELHERVFDPFFTTKDSEQGTGLGLSICRAIVEEMGGAIHLDSTIGQGTTMRIKLPAEASATNDDKRCDTQTP